MGKRITPRQARFIEAFVRCRNGAAAARDAGYSPSRARQAAHELRYDPRFAHVAAELKRRLEDREEQDRVQHEIMTAALIQRITFDPGVLEDPETGELLPLSHLEPEDRRHVASIQRSGYKHGKGELDVGGEDADASDQAGVSVSYKLTNQLEAIKILGKHNGFFSPRVTAGETAAYRDADEFLAGMFNRIRRRAAEPVPGEPDAAPEADS